MPHPLEDEERREPAKVGVTQTRAHEDTFRAIDPLIDRGAQLVQLGELVARVVRDQEPDGLEPFREPRCDCRAQLVEPRARLSRHLRRVEKPVRQPPSPERIDEVDLVEHDLDRQLVRADLGQDGIDRGDHLLHPLVVGRRIDHVEHQVGGERLLERRCEPLDQLVRKAADETDRVGHEVPPAVVVEAPRRRIERLEQPIVHGCAGPRQRIEQRRLADVGVPGQRHRRGL